MSPAKSSVCVSVPSTPKSPMTPKSPVTFRKVLSPQVSPVGKSSVDSIGLRSPYFSSNGFCTSDRKHQNHVDAVTHEFDEDCKFKYIMDPSNGSCQRVCTETGICHETSEIVQEDMGYVVWICSKAAWNHKSKVPALDHQSNFSDMWKEDGCFKRPAMVDGHVVRVKPASRVPLEMMCTQRPMLLPALRPDSKVRPMRPVNHWGRRQDEKLSKTRLHDAFQ